MIERDNFESLVRQIVSRSIPEELVVYDIESSVVISQLFESGGTYAAAPDSTDETPEPKFDLPISEIIEGVKFLSVVLGTYKTIKELMPKRSDSVRTDALVQEIGDKWAKELTASGLSKKKAERISLEFREDLMQLLKPQKL
jgi:hypothetical protein